jgi:hypothetical protein
MLKWRQQFCEVLINGVTLQVGVLTSCLQSRILETCVEAGEAKTRFKYLGNTVTSIDVRDSK